MLSLIMFLNLLVRKCIAKYNFFQLSSSFEDFLNTNINILPNPGIKNYALF